ncbi:MAG: polyphenol oxidase family protein [Acidimicrobiales bacterium]|nr:polyphenol oxidase family protein [Acidimicrobiales bacterium]
MARELARRSLPSGRTARVVMSEAADGDAAKCDLAIDGLMDTQGQQRPWTSLHQVHGDGVVVVEFPGDRSGSHADGAITVASGSPLAVRVADCMPVALLGDHSVGVVHAGWRGLLDGVVERTIEVQAALDGSSITEATIGPHIRPCCYEFHDMDIDKFVERFGPSARSKTSEGQPALDLAAILAVILDQSGIPGKFDVSCTACDHRYWSFRATATTCRQAMVAWIEES